MKWGISFWVQQKVDGNRDTTWSEFPNEGEAMVKQILASDEIKIQKSGTVRVTVWDPSREVNYLRKIIWDRKIITKFTSL